MVTKKHKIGDTIVKLRKEKGWTQNELAEKLQVSDKAISKWESNKGDPSIEFLPELARLFDITIDYLMTGKEPEEKIITMSKLELCAKKDNEKMLSEINIDSKDENGKLLIDYAIKYNAKKVLSFYFQNKTLKEVATGLHIPVSNIDNLFDTFLYYYSYLNILPVLEEKLYKETRHKIGCKEGQMIQYYLDTTKRFDGYIAKLFEMLVKDTDIKSETFDILFSKWNNQIYYDNAVFGSIIWVKGIQELLDYAVRFENNKILKKYLTFIENFNNQSMETRKKNPEKPYYERTPFYSQERKQFELANPLISIKKDTIDYLIENNTVSMVDKFVELNQKVDGYVPSDYELKMFKLKNDKKSSKEDILIQSVIHDGVICIDELLIINNLKLQRKVLNDYPIHPLEYVVNYYQNKKWKQLFKWAVDNNEDKLAEFAMNPIIPECSYEESPFCDVFQKLFIKYFNNKMINRKYIDEALKICKSNNYANKQYNWCLPFQIPVFKTCRDLIIKQIEEREQNLKVIDALTLNYFTKQLNQKNYEMVIIKLCTRLETILKFSYGYVGTFEEMLSEFCANNMCDEKTAELLNKLRKHRNNIVHGEKFSDELSNSELKSCINYVCSLN